jgi:hypothetical protein
MHRVDAKAMNDLVPPAHATPDFSYVVCDGGDRIHHCPAW